ncbi:transcriptional regulator, AbrB family [Clostridium sp. DL-VIII]|uniref:AbrB/MazE/SpoVT family DNA-binding domain-containing protein n=1 Tax=Clostridium sp. DL-VIII TaxID=641107 RepID=UPI00023AF106|nr:AbrB/MazE/SpoVT family DNA-binding domain-containing protein [Clostridium sp. DL-VIII]EHI97558.1 transcriptional regulator, AbrB family [Clostridium sp. DL-VIII]
MRASGIIRNVDPLGRVVIPKEMRKVMEINEGDPIEIVKVNNEIVLRKYSKGCIFCGNDENVSEFNDLSVCSSCRKALGQN